MDAGSFCAFSAANFGFYVLILHLVSVIIDGFMSDGHFNRSFLPHGDFASGVRVGRASERVVCMGVFAEMLGEICPGVSESDRIALTDRFRSLVLQREK